MSEGGGFTRTFFLMSALSSTVSVTTGIGGQRANGTSNTIYQYAGTNTTFGTLALALGGGVALNNVYSGFADVPRAVSCQSSFLGGGGGATTNSTGGGDPFGISFLAGNGGALSLTTANGQDGFFPAGGGGDSGDASSSTPWSGAGANGQAKIWVF